MKLIAVKQLAAKLGALPLGAELLDRAIKEQNEDYRFIHKMSPDHWKESILLMRGMADYLTLLDSVEVIKMRRAVEQAAFCLAES